LGPVPRHEIAMQRERVGQDPRDAAHDGEYAAAAALEETLVDVRRI